MAPEEGAGDTPGTWRSRSEGIRPALPLGSLRLDFPRLVIGLVLLAVLAGGWSVDLWLVVAVGMWALGRLAVGRAFPVVRFRFRLDRTHAFAGEWVRGEVAVTNPAWWPLPWVEIASVEPDDLVGGLRRVEWLPGGARRLLPVAWFARRRGVYRAGSLVLRGGDWFGLFADEREVAPQRTIVVYPRTWPVSRAPQERRLPEGPRRDRASPFEDQLPAGLRPYRPGDPRRRIAWRASAHHDTLLVRETPTVREIVTCLFINLHAVDWADRDAGPERAVSLAASLLCDPRLARRPIGVGTWAATTVRAARGPASEEPPRALWLPPSGAETARRAAMRLLAAVEPVPRADPPAAPPFPEVLRLLGSRLPWGAQSIWIVPRDTSALRELAAGWQARGFPVTLLCLERREGGPAERIGGATLQAWEVVQRAGFEVR